MFNTTPKYVVLVYDTSLGGTVLHLQNETLNSNIMNHLRVGGFFATQFIDQSKRLGTLDPGNLRRAAKQYEQRC